MAVMIPMGLKTRLIAIFIFFSILIDLSFLCGKIYTISVLSSGKSRIKSLYRGLYRFLNVILCKVSKPQ